MQCKKCKKELGIGISNKEWQGYEGGLCGECYAIKFDAMSEKEQLDVFYGGFKKRGVTSIYDV